MVPLLWTQRQDIGPSARMLHSLAYDEARQQTLLYGGWNARQVPADEAYFADTWLWDGSAWTQAEDTGPGKRSSHATVYDSVRKRVVLFGGRFDQDALGDTWEWDGEAWTQVADTGPAARHLHAAAFDSERARVLVFGGIESPGILGDTWTWDGEAWTQVADTGPSPRYGHAMCFEESNGRAILFGGSDFSGGSGVPDTWSWGGARWTQLNDVGPRPSLYPALAATGRGSILFGGLNLDSTSILDSLVESTWELIGDDWTERQNMGPSGRWGHALAYDTLRERVVLFGGDGWQQPGRTGGIDILSDTWELPAGPAR